MLIVELEGRHQNCECQCQNTSDDDDVFGADLCAKARRKPNERLIEHLGTMFHSRLRATIMYWVSTRGQRVFCIRMSARSRIEAITSDGCSGRSSGNFHMPIISMNLRVI